MANKAGNPNWRPGVSGNPSGRPRGAAGLARYVAEQTDDGRELIDRLLHLSRDPEAPVREATSATMALIDRLAGKPMQPSEIAMQIEATASAPALPAAFASWTPDQRLEWLDRERARRALPAGDQ